MVFFTFLYVLVVLTSHISTSAERKSSGLQLHLFLTVVVSVITRISRNDLLLSQAFMIQVPAFLKEILMSGH